MRKTTLLVLVVVALPAFADDMRVTVPIEKSMSVTSFRLKLGESGAKLGLPSACAWAFGASTSPHPSCRALTVKLDDGFTIDGWMCDGMALMTTPNMSGARYDAGKFTLDDEKGGPRPVMLNVADTPDSSAVVFKRINEKKSQFKMAIWPVNCVDAANDPFEGDRPVPAPAKKKK